MATGTQTCSAAWDLNTMQSSTKRQPKDLSKPNFYNCNLIQLNKNATNKKVKILQPTCTDDSNAVDTLVWSLDEGAKASWAGRVRSGTFPYIMGYYYIGAFDLTFAQCLRSVLPTQQKSAIFLQFSGIIWKFLQVHTCWITDAKWDRVLSAILLLWSQLLSRSAVLLCVIQFYRLTRHFLAS